MKPDLTPFPDEVPHFQEEHQEQTHEEKRGGCGCGGCLSCLSLAVTFIFALAVILYLSLGWIIARLPEGPVKEFLAKNNPAGITANNKPAPSPAPPPASPSPGQTDSRELVKNLRDKAAAIQKDFEELQKTGKLREKLENLRMEATRKQVAAEEGLESAWKEVVRHTDDLLDKTKQKAQDLRSVDMETLKKQLDQMSKLLPTTATKSDKSAALPANADEVTYKSGKINTKPAPKPSETAVEK